MTVEDHSAKGSGLGKHTDYVSQYDPGQLYPIARSIAREQLAIPAQALPFTGTDLWTAWELSWLNSRGLPQVAMAEFSLPVTSDNIIESKSFKLYLNSFNQTKFERWQDVHEALARDLSAAAGGDVGVRLLSLSEAQKEYPVFELCEVGLAQCLDNSDIAIEHYQPNPMLLQLDPTRAGQTVNEALYSNLLKTNCPVTGQPDWATLWVHYTGPAIDRASLLAYIVSFRDHQDFHEQCVERCFMDIQQRLAPSELSVYARYTRRGGLDINPFRSTCGEVPEGWRLVRQ